MPVQVLGALMLKAGKAAEAAKHLQQALDIKVNRSQPSVNAWPADCAAKYIAVAPCVPWLADLLAAPSLQTVCFPEE